MLIENKSLYPSIIEQNTIVHSGNKRILTVEGLVIKWDLLWKTVFEWQHNKHTLDN